MLTTPRPSRRSASGRRCRAPARRRSWSPPCCSSVEQAALDRADRWRARRCRTASWSVAGVVADVLQHRAQVLEVEQQQAVVVGDLEDDVEHAFLRVVQVRGCAPAAAAPSRDTVARTGWPCSPKTSQKSTGKPAQAGVVDARGSAARASNFGVASPGLAMPDRSPFTSAMNTGTPIAGEALGQHLQRHGLAGAGGAGDRGRGGCRISGGDTGRYRSHRRRSKGHRSCCNLSQRDGGIVGFRHEFFPVLPWLLLATKSVRRFPK